MQNFDAWRTASNKQVNKYLLHVFVQRDGSMQSHRIERKLQIFSRCVPLWCALCERRDDRYVYACDLLVHWYLLSKLLLSKLRACYNACSGSSNRTSTIYLLLPETLYYLFILCLLCILQFLLLLPFSSLCSQYIRLFFRRFCFHSMRYNWNALGILLLFPFLSLTTIWMCNRLVVSRISSWPKWNFCLNFNQCERIFVQVAIVSPYKINTCINIVWLAAKCFTACDVRAATRAFIIIIICNNVASASRLWFYFYYVSCASLSSHSAYEK